MTNHNRLGPRLRSRYHCERLVLDGILRKGQNLHWLINPEIVRQLIPAMWIGRDGIVGIDANWSILRCLQIGTRDLIK
jgi:hypothetical protein